MKRIFALILVLAMVLIFFACDKEENSGGSIPENKPDEGKINAEQQEPEKNEEPENEEKLPADIANPDYESMIEYINWVEGYCGVAYVGFVEGPMGDGYGELFEQGGFMEGYSFVADIPSERFVETAGYELYCIVPASLDYSVKVEEVFFPEGTDSWELETGDIIYQSETGEPILLLCNESEIFSNVSVTLTSPDGTEKIFSPYLSGMDGSLAGIDDDGLTAVDFTPIIESADYYANFDELLGEWIMNFYPDGITSYIVGLKFFYNDYGQQCVNFWYGLEFSDMDEHFSGTVYEYYETDGTWQGIYILDMYLDGGTGYEGESRGHVCSYKFHIEEDGSLIAAHCGEYSPLFTGYENEWFEFYQPKG